MMANRSFDSVQSYGSCVLLQNALYGCTVRLFVLKTSKQLPNKARKKNKKNLKKTKKNVLKQLKKTSLKKTCFFTSLHGSNTHRLEDLDDFKISDVIPGKMSLCTSI